MSTMVELSRFLLSFSFLSHSAFALTIVISGINRKNSRLLFLLLALAAYPAMTYLFITTNSIFWLNIFQKLDGTAGILVATTAVYFLYNFPTKRPTTALYKVFYLAAVPVIALAIYPGFWPNTVVINDHVQSKTIWTAVFLVIYVLTAIVLIIIDTYRHQASVNARLKRHIFKYFMAFAFIATMTDVLIPSIHPQTTILLTASASASSVIFSIGLYTAYRKSGDTIIHKHSFTRLLTIFFVLMIVYTYAISVSQLWIVRLIMIALSVKVGYDTITQIAHEQKQHQELKRDHQANMLFISDIAHRLKTPLAIIQFKTAPNQPYTKEAREEVHEVAKTTVATLRNIVQTGKIDADLAELSRKTINLQDWVRDQQAQIEDLAPNHSVRLITQGHTLVSVDQLYMREALYNLVDNARKFSPKGSTITISATSDNKICALSVHNTGSTIHQKDLPHIFDRHYQSDGTRQKFAGSAGLGLSLVKWVAEAHDGSVNVTSTPTGGTTFTILVPLAKHTPASHTAIKKILTEG